MYVCMAWHDMTAPKPRIQNIAALEGVMREGSEGSICSPLQRQSRKTLYMYRLFKKSNMLVLRWIDRLSKHVACARLLTEMAAAPLGGLGVYMASDN